MSVKVSKTSPEELRRTPLHALHLALGARMVPFAGYDMPLQFESGVLKEHLHTRAAAGLFDVSHMGQIRVLPKSGNIADAARALERLVPADILGMAPDRQRYVVFTNDSGGIHDDAMVANRGDHLLLIVNAACKEADEDRLRVQLADECAVERSERALLALQGPNAEAVLARFAPDCTSLRFMDVRQLLIMGVDCIVMRSGYTGEDGFEISMPSDVAQEISEGLLEDPNVKPIGLGARDTLRLEAGLCLYGSDIDETTTPVEASLAWVIPNVRRRNGERGGGFPGASTIFDQLEHGVMRRRIGLRPEGRIPVRVGAALFARGGEEGSIGNVTSGGFSPTLNAPIAMGYLPSSVARTGNRVFAEVRGQRLPAIVAGLPFVSPRYKRS